MFKEAFAKRRCLVPAPVYYEWRDDPEGKTPFAVARVDGDPVAFAGIWEAWKSPTVNGYRPSPRSRRTRTIFWPESRLGEAEEDVQAQLRPAAEDTLWFWPVGKAVGNVRNDGPELLEAATLAEPTLL